MLTLFYKPTCPFCQRVLGEAEGMGLTMNLRDISSDTVALEALIEKGGKKMVPFLEDTDRGITMYESGDIVAYLTEHYKDSPSETSFNGVRVHKSDDTCETCQ